MSVGSRDSKVRTVVLLAVFAVLGGAVAPCHAAQAETAPALYGAALPVIVGVQGWLATKECWVQVRTPDRVISAVLLATPCVVACMGHPGAGLAGAAGAAMVYGGRRFFSRTEGWRPQQVTKDAILAGAVAAAGAFYVSLKG